jgi:DNA (cytosine-5)-methyltransferase 1
MSSTTHARIVAKSSQPSYLDVLEQAWVQHLVPREAGAPTVISTFAGCGGSSLGYSMAGYRELLAVEWDQNAVDTFRLNFPDVPVWHGDIAKLSVDECMERAGLQPGELDVFDGSPPCQGFSTAGKREMADPRNQLFREYVRLLRGLRPKVFVMENVSGMVKGKMKLIFADILRELKASGYTVSARLMNAMYFNVPQSRQRMIFVGVREDLGMEPSHPLGSSRLVTLRDAWRDVQNAEDDIAAATYPVTCPQDRLLRLMKPWEQGSKYDPKGNMFGLKRLDFARPSRTVLREDGGGQSCACCHPTEHRRVTIPELRRIGSYPDRMQFIGNYKTQWARIGNSVPPLFMRAIAQHIREHILNG